MGDEPKARRTTEALVRSHDYLRNGVARLKPVSVAWKRAGKIRLLVEAYWERHNPGVPLTWGGREQRACDELIRATRLCGLDFEKLIRNREAYPGVNHKQRPSKWLRNLPNYARAPERKEA
jgi:hypothetical protein